MTMRHATLLAGLGGLALLAASMLPGWVETERVIVGYGSARVVWHQDAWSGFFVPWLPLGVLLAGGAAGLLGLTAMFGRTRPLRRGSVVLALAAAAALLGVLVAGHDTLTPTPATTWTGEPGWLVTIGLATAAGIALVAAAATDRPRVAPVAPGAGASILLSLLILTTACTAGPGPSGVASPDASAGGVPDWRTDPREPYPFTSPVPELTATELDGEYTRPPTDTYAGDRAACRRCPPYPLDRGASILRFDRGRFEIVHVEPAYRSLGHFTVEGDLLTLLNDPECGTEIGTYRVERDGAQLRFDVVEDPCAFGQRTRDLTDRTWTPTDIAGGQSCQPPNTEAAVSGHWPEPSGC